ncbi:hypothetical protein KOI40_07390 [Aestuariicella sp. G3-2]|uniref:hypothetical protein n=1 Tax=Pseudomaricurvus albidus TaxID=2842452 RepID=UPI001C0E4B72|nr:hypothetical protein [Aestuariicella albida]MBU3069639.1 hypothetical protein [Aestuariicella albida]
MPETSCSTYRVVFWGDVAEGQSRRDVALKFARKFRINDSKTLRRIFSGRLLTLKRGLSESEAQRYCQAITDLGACSRMEAEAPLAGSDWGSAELQPKRPRHTASIHFDTMGLDIQDLIAAQADTKPVEDSGVPGSRNPFGARDLAEAEHPPVKYYDGRPVS